MKLRCLLVLALAGTCGMVPVGRAAEPLRLTEAVARALAANPGLSAESARLEANRARARREALPTPYAIGVDVENLAGSGTLHGVNAAETTLRISRVIELGGKRVAREALGDAEIDLQAHLIQQARIEVASRTTTRFIEVLADQRRLAYARERLAQAELTRREVAAWVRAARNPETDLLAAELTAAKAQLDLEHAEHELESARLTLAASWGASSPDFETLEGDLQALPELEPFADLSRRLPESSMQRAAQFEAGVLSARRRIAMANRSPDISVSLGVRRIEGLGDQGLVVSASMPLGSRPRAAFSIAEVDAHLAAVEARREAERVESHQILFEKYQEIRHARTEVETLRETMLPKAEQALADTRRGFEAGRFSFQALTQAQNTLFELRERAVEAAARFHTLLVEVERLTASTEDTTP